MSLSCTDVNAVVPGAAANANEYVHVEGWPASAETTSGVPGDFRGQ